VSKAEIEGVRGVSTDHTVRALLELNLIRTVGRSELPGRPFLYGTTSTFLEHFGLKSIKELQDS
jgi:segregation and condensation protein B